MVQGWGIFPTLSLTGGPNAFPLDTIMKKHPAMIDDLGGHRRSRSKTQELVDDIITRVSKNDNARNIWLNRQSTYYNRRYVREDRNVTWPWPGASDIVMPTIDLTIDRLKAAFSRIIFTRPLATFKVRNPDFQPQARLNEVFFDWLLEEGVPNFKKEMLIALDEVLQKGMCVMKVFWDYRTVNATRILKFDELPQQIARLLPQQATQRDILRNASLPARQQARQLLGQAREVFKQAIAEFYNLDAEDETDKTALQKITTAFVRGAKQVKYVTREEIANNPRAVCVDHQDLIVPKETQSIEDAREVTQRFWLTRSALKARARDNGWSKAAVDHVLSKEVDPQGPTRQQHTITANVPILRDKDFREGITTLATEELIEFWEHYQWLDIDRDGRDEMVVMPLHPGSSTLMKDIREVPFEHGEWPFIQLTFEANDRRFYSSRGVPEKLDDIDREITIRHRNKLNNLDMMVPSFTYRFGSEFNPDMNPFMPGSMMPVLSPDDLNPVPIPDRTIPDEREENILLTWSQNYLGGFESGLAQQQNITEARTATEVAAIQRTATELLAFRAETLNVGLKRLYKMLWALWNQWGKESTYVKVTSQPMLRLSKEDIKKQYEIAPAGTVFTTDPQLQAQKAFARLQVLLPLLDRPELFQTFEINFEAAILDFLTWDDPVAASRIIRQRTQQEIQQIQQQQMQQQQAVAAAERNEPQTPGETLAALKEIERRAPFRQRQRVVPPPAVRR